MSSTDEIKPAGKSGRRSRKSQRSKTADSVAIPAAVELQSANLEQAPTPEPAQAANVTVDPTPEVGEQVDITLAAAEPPSAVTPSPAPPVSLQTIANAYRDYTRKSFEQFGSYVEELSGVRSIEKAMTVQSEFVKRACATSIAESQRIYELHNKLARQTFNPFRGWTGKAPETHGKS